MKAYQDDPVYSEKALDFYFKVEKGLCEEARDVGSA